MNSKVLRSEGCMVRMTLGHLYTSVKDSVNNREFEQNCEQSTKLFYRYLIQLRLECLLIAEQPNPAREDVIMIPDDHRRQGDRF